VICGITSQSGPNLEPLACGYKRGHDGAHSWSTLPTWAETAEVWRCDADPDHWHAVSEVFWQPSDPDMEGVERTPFCNFGTCPGVCSPWRAYRECAPNSAPRHDPNHPQAGRT
jgi:hypothetical protein